MRTCLIFFSLMLFGNLSIGQSFNIEGNVSDANSGNPLTGAHITLSGGNFGAVSDYKGYFLIKDVPQGEYEVLATYIGYESYTQKLNVGPGAEYSISASLKPKPYLADEAVITASRTQVALNITPLTVSLVTRQDLENDGGSNLLPIVGKQVPGVFVTERGITGFGVADGAAGRISIRGVGGSPNTQVLVLIDGHPQYMGIFGHPLPDAYVASDAESVEVVRGPASVLYGSNAMGGVINIISRQQAKDGITLQGKAEYGSFNTFKFNAAAGFRKKKLQAFVSYNKDKTDGHRLNSDFNIDNVYGKLSYDLNSHFRVWADVSLARYESTNPGPVNSTDTTYIFPTHWQSIERGYSSAAIENKYQRSEGALKFYYNWGLHSLWDGFESSDKNFGLMIYQAVKLFKGNTVTIGYDYASYGGKAENVIPEVPVQLVDTSIKENGVYLLAQQNLIDRLTFTAGIRYQHHELFGPEWIPQAGATYRISINTSLKANVSKGFRSPSIRELFMFKPANPELNPENMWNYEAGLMQKLMDQKISAEITGFYINGDNLIQTTGVFPDVLNENTGAFEHYGLEIQAKYLVIENLDLLLNYSWLHTDKAVVAAPEHMIYLQGNYKRNGFMCNLSLQYINQLVTQVSPLETESYLLLSARASYKVADLVTFYIDGNNLLNQDYTINYGYPMPGISVMAGVNIKWMKGF